MWINVSDSGGGLRMYVSASGLDCCWSKPSLQLGMLTQQYTHINTQLKQWRGETLEMLQTDFAREKLNPVRLLSREVWVGLDVYAGRGGGG